MTGTLSQLALRIARAMVWVSAVATIGGCREAESIRQYSVPKQVGQKLPAGWMRAIGDQMSLAAYQVGDAEASARITVTALAAAGGDLLPNVNRWRGQLGLPPLEADQLAEAVQPFDLPGAEAKLVEIAGGEKSIVGVIAVQGGRAWFYKMMGDPSVVDREKSSFEQFVRSYHENTPQGSADGK